MTAVSSQPGPRANVWRPRQRAHWWLASVLVGCLLPAGLVHAEALRFAERLAHVYLMAPEAIRAESRRAAKAPSTHPQSTRLEQQISRIDYSAPPARVTTALDALSRRGPPSSA